MEKLLKECTDTQRTKVRRYLVIDCARDYAPAELKRAVEAFDAGDYSNRSLKRYIDHRVIKRIFED